MEITAPTVVFWFIVMLAGDERPTRFVEPVESLPACEFEAKEFLRKPPHELLLRGGMLRAGCQVTFESSVEH